MRDLLVLHLHHRTPVDAPFSSSGGYVRQRALVGAAGAPANDDVTLTRGEDRLHIEVQIGKRREVDLEELPRPLMPHERRWKGVRLPYCLRVQPLQESLHVVRVPSRKALSGDMKVVRSSHGQPPPNHARLCNSASACSSQKRMSISRYIVVAMVRCSCAWSRLPVRR